MLGVCKQDNVTVHGGQMCLGHAEEQEENKNAVHFSPSRGRQAHSRRGQSLQATAAQFTNDSAAHYAESGDDLTCGTRRWKRSNNHNIICCSEKGRFRTRPGFKLKSTSHRRIALRRAPCCNLMWAYQPRSTRQSASLCAKEPPHTNLRRLSVRWSLPSQSSCRRVRQ